MRYLQTRRYGEEVRNSDGQDKQDCELHAAKRLIARLRQEHPQLPLIIRGDTLYCHEPFLTQLRELGLHHGLVCKQTSHVELYEWVEDIERCDGCSQGQWPEGPACRRRFYPYRIAPSMPLTASHRLWGTLVEVWEHDREGKQLYHNAWFTDLEVTSDNVAAMVRIGRSRWQIDNESFNVHKNQGYELEHNDDHGQQT